MKVGYTWFMVAVLLAYVAQGSIWYTAPIIFSRVFSSNYFEVGLLFSLIPLIEIAAAIPFGYMADFGKVKHIAFNSTLALLLVPFLLATNLNVLIAVGVLLLGIGGEGIWIATNSYVANIIGKRSIKYIGYEFALMGIGWITGPMLGGFVLGASDRLVLTVIEMLLLAIGSFIFLRVLKVKISVAHIRAPKFIKILRSESALMRELPSFVLPFLLLGFIFSFFGYVVWIAVPLLTLITSAGIFAGGMVIGFVNIPYAIGDVLAGKLYKKGKEKTIVSVCLILAAFFMLLSALLVNESFYSLIILLGTALFVTFAEVGVFSAVIDSAKKDTGEISALETVSGGIGGAFAAIVTGATVAQYGLWVVSGIFVTLIAVYLVYLHFRNSDF